jgi:Zn-dependent protease with chaperone function/type II secretory pathway pseudopilin PulG
MPLDPRLRSPKEPPLFVLGVIFSAITWLLVVVSIVGLLYALLGALFLLSAHALFLAHVRVNGVRVDERQLPELHARVRAAAARLGLAQLPEVYVLQGSGLLNAFATKLFSRRYVILLSDLVDHCEDPRQLDFVVAHELGHLAAGHLSWLLFLLPFRLVPWLGAAYSRACEYTCDRCGLAGAGDLEQSQRGLVVLAAGGRVAAQVDLAAFASQRAEAAGFWATVLELNAAHPFLCKRVAALEALVNPAAVAPVGRSAAGWVLAPALGLFSGGAGAAPLLAVVAIVGVLAALAIPNFTKHQLRSKEAVGRADLRSLHQAEVAHFARSGAYLELRAPEQAPGTAAVPWGADDLAAARALDWTLGATTHHTFGVAVGETRDGKAAFATCAEADLDGDGIYSAWATWEPVEDEEGDLVAPKPPCSHATAFVRSTSFQAGDAPGTPVKLTAPDTY